MAASSTSGTTFKLDIVKFAKDIMAEVDSIRSYLPTVGDDSQPANNRPTESRVNAFFRLIGLPMFVSVKADNSKGASSTDAAETVLTPGFAHGTFPWGIVTNSSSVEMWADPKTKQSLPLRTLLDRREQTLLRLEQEIGTQKRDARRVSAFYYPLNLMLYKDGFDGNGGHMFRMVPPFVVSYMPIYPAQNELSKPFLADPESGRPPPDSTPIRRPFIETVIRIRTAGLGGGNQAQTDYLKAARTQLGLVSPVAAALLPTQPSLYEAFIIDQMLGSLDQLANLWVNLQRRRESISKDSTIVLKPKTFSAKANPFGKQSNFVLDLNISDTSNLGQRRTALENSIAISEAMLSLLPAQDLVSLSGEKTRNVMPNALTNSFVSVLRQPIEAQRKKLNELNAAQDRQAQQADSLRLSLEMMTGEFTGLSVPDVVFTILGLFLVDVEDLLGLLDSDTIDEMLKDPVLETAIKNLSQIEPAAAVEKLQSKVNNLYETLEDTVKVRIKRDTRTSKNSAPSEKLQEVLDAPCPKDLQDKMEGETS